MRTITPGALAEALVWWLALTGIWLLTTSSVSDAELVLSFGCSLPCAAIAVVVRRVVGDRWQWPSPALRWAARIPVEVVADSAAVLAVPFRMLAGRADGHGQVIRVPVHSGASHRAESIRTAATWLVSTTPGSVVLHADADTGELLVHTLGGRAGITEAVRR